MAQQELAPRGPNESVKEARERRQQVMVDAWNEIDKDEQSRLASEAALAAQETEAAKAGSTMPALTDEQKAARISNNAEIKADQAKKKTIEKQWRDEFKCPFNRLFRNIENPAEDDRNEDMIEELGEQEGTSEQIAEL